MVRGYRWHDWQYSLPPTPPQKNGSLFSLSPFDVSFKHAVSARQVGFVTKSANFCSPDASDQIGARDGFRHRVCIKPPVATPWFHRRFRQFVQQWLRDNVKVTGAPLSVEEWLPTVRCNEARREQLRASYEQGKLAILWSKVKSFIKREFYPEFKPPRLINSRVDNYKVWAGPWFSWVEHSVCAQVKAFVKGMNLSDRRERIDAGMQYKYIYGSDFSRFESQMTPEVMLACECLLYRHFGVPEEFLRPLYGVNRLRFRCARATIQGTRMSGDMCTSLGNGFTNLMVNLYVAQLNNSRISGFVEGDDGIFSVDVLPTQAQFAACGFKMSIAGTPRAGECGFCSTYWAEDGLPVLDPIRHLLRVGWSFHCPKFAPDAYRAELFRAKCRSLLDLAPSCPLICAIAYWHDKEGKCKFAPDYYKFGDRAGTTMLDPGHEFVSPSVYQRELVSKLFGISVTDQLACEKSIRAGDLDCLIPFCSIAQKEASYFQGLENDEF